MKNKLFFLNIYLIKLLAFILLFMAFTCILFSTLTAANMKNQKQNLHILLKKKKPNYQNKTIHRESFSRFCTKEDFLQG